MERSSALEQCHPAAITVDRCICRWVHDEHHSTARTMCLLDDSQELPVTGTLVRRQHKRMLNALARRDAQ
jgi:hypothetical protein